MNPRFAEKTFLITGATGAIASEIAKLAWNEGANVVLSDRFEENLTGLAQEMGMSRVGWYAGDVRDPGCAAASVKMAKELFGGIDALIPAAGIYTELPFSEMSEVSWRETMDINLDSVFRLTHAALPLLRDDSAIVNIASIAAHRGSKHHAHYATTKGALLSLTRSLALELAPRTRVNAVSPGIIKTAMTEQLLLERGEELRHATPMRRFGTAKEVAEVVLFLASHQSSFINGEVIHVNGGLYMD